MTNFILISQYHSLYGCKWSCHNPKAVICIIHGLGEYAERYDTTARFFTNTGFTVYGIDLNGHGHSEGKRGDIGWSNEVANDIDCFIKYALEDSNNLPIFLFGHSMGGNISLYHRLSRPSSFVKGYIISSPWLTLKKSPSIFKIFSLKCASLLSLNRTFSARRIMKETSPDNNVADDYVKDPLIHPFITPRTALFCIDDAKEILKYPDIPAPPVFLIHGTRDSICSFEASVTFSEQSKGRITLYPIPDGGHETMHKREYILALEKALSFLENILSKY